MSKKKDKIKDIDAVMERIIEESFRIMPDDAMYSEFFDEEKERDSYTGELIDKKKDREKKENDKE